MKNEKKLAEQIELCRKYGAEFLASPDELKAGVARAVRDHVSPINGLRQPPEGDTTGWYIWAGDYLSEAEDFFQPLHVKHLEEWCPQVTRYLGLSPGWRFQISNNHEDAWFDPRLLNLED